MVRREKYREVITTYKRMIDQNNRRGGKSGSKGKDKVPEGSFVCNGTLYKPAQNDDWY